MEPVHILIVDDNPEHVESMKRVLEEAPEEYKVSAAYDGISALSLVQKLQPDLILLDIYMFHLDGKEVIRRLRAAGNNVLIIVVSLHGKDAAERVMMSDEAFLLRLGADDVIPKGSILRVLTTNAYANPDLLLARIQALLRRRPVALQAPLEEVLSYADVTLHLSTREVRRGAYDLELSPKQFDLLVLFLRHPQQVLKRDLILEHVWGFDFLGESNVVDVYVGYLRHILEAHGGSRLIQTVRGVGYTLKEPKGGK